MVKFLEIGSVPIGTAQSLDDAEEVCFGTRTLQKVHGEDVFVGPWKRNRRQLQTNTPLPTGYPAALRVFSGNTDRLRMTISQRKVYSEDGNNTITMNNKVRIHVLGAELCCVRPEFRFAMNPETKNLTFGCKIKMYAVLPPPLDKICEHFMLQTCKSEIALYIESMRAHAHAQVLAEHCQGVPSGSHLTHDGQAPP